MPHQVHGCVFCIYYLILRRRCLILPVYVLFVRVVFWVMTYRKDRRNLDDTENLTREFGWHLNVDLWQFTTWPDNFCFFWYWTKYPNFSILLKIVGYNTKVSKYTSVIFCLTVLQHIISSSNNFYPPKGKCESTPAGVHLISLDLN